MDEKAFAAAVSKFLKTVSFTTQREVEKALRKSLASGKLKGHETFTVAVMLASEKIGLNVTIHSKIEL